MLHWLLYNATGNTTDKFLKRKDPGPERFVSVVVVIERVMQSAFVVVVVLYCIHL